MNLTPAAPLYSLLALLVMPLLGTASIPFWNWRIDSQIKSGSNEMYSPDPGQFGGFGVIFGIVVTGWFGALIGLGFVWFAKRRRERWPWLRSISLLVNGFAGLAGAALLIQHLIRTHD